MNLALPFNFRSSTQGSLLNWIEATQKNGRKSVSTTYLNIVRFVLFRPFAKDSTYLRFRGANVSREKKHGQDHVENDVSVSHFAKFWIRWKMNEKDTWGLKMKFYERRVHKYPHTTVIQNREDRVRQRNCRYDIRRAPCSVSVHSLCALMWCQLNGLTNQRAVECVSIKSFCDRRGYVYGH